MFRHFWQPNLRSAFWVGYNKYETRATAPASVSFAPDLKIWQVGGNIIWSPAPTLDLSLDVLWTRLETGDVPGALAAASVDLQPERGHLVGLDPLAPELLIRYA